MREQMFWLQNLIIFAPPTTRINCVLNTRQFVIKWQWASVKFDHSWIDSHIYLDVRHIFTQGQNSFLLMACCSIFQEIDSFLLTWQVQHSCQSSIFDFSHTLLFLCSTLINVNKLYLNVCLCLSVRPCVWLVIVMKRRKELTGDDGCIDWWGRRLAYRLGWRVILQGLPIGTLS